jgi:thioredoxin
MSEPIHVTDDEFQEKVLESPVPVIVDFWAPWCGPCRAIAPSLEELAKEYGDKLTVAKVNVDENINVATRFQVTGIPALFFIKDGKVVDRMVGAYPKPSIQQRVDNMLAAVAQ